MKEIELTQGKVALVDDDVYEWASKFKWYADKNGCRFYAARNSPPDPITGKKTKIYLHREIMKPGSGEETDHKFGDGLDDRRNEMRNVTKTQNGQAFHKPKGDTSSKFRGVCWRKGEKKWMAYITIAGRRTYLGHFESEGDAARAYDKSAHEHFGEFAQPNFPA